MSTENIGVRPWSLTGCLTVGKRSSPGRRPFLSHCPRCVQPGFSEALEAPVARSSIGVHRMQRNFEPMRTRVENWRAQQLSASAAAKLTIYRAFIEGDMDVPRHLAREVHELYFKPQLRCTAFCRAFLARRHG